MSDDVELWGAGASILYTSKVRDMSFTDARVD